MELFILKCIIAVLIIVLLTALIIEIKQKNEV
jgi:hypothetical protein